MIIDNDIFPAVLSHTVIPELTNYIEEADPKIPPHLDYLVKVEKSFRHLVLLNGADSFALELRYILDLNMGVLVV